MNGNYWKVRTSYERKGADLVALYGHARYFKTASEAEYRCRELNEAKGQSPELIGTYFFEERFIRGGVYEDEEAQIAIGSH